MSDIQHAIDMYLDAIERSYGPSYRRDVRITVAGGHFIRISHPEVSEGEVVTVDHLELMTRNLLAAAGPARKAA